MNPAVFLAEIDLLSPAAGPVTLYLSDLPIRPFAPDDADRPNQVYDDRLVEPPVFAWEVFADLAGATPAIGAGTIAIKNADGALNPYRDHAWVAVRLYWARSGAPFAHCQPVLAGRLSPPRYEISADRPSRVTVDLLDYRAALQVDLQPVSYAGTNSGSAGYEGGAGDLKGQPKPVALGDLADASVPAVWANRSRQVVQVHDGPVAAILAVAHMGADAGLTADGDYAGGAFDALTPADGHWATDLGRGLAILKSALPGTVTLSCRGSAAGGYADTAPPIIRRLIEEGLGADAAFAADWDAFDAPAKVGFWTQQPVQRLEVIDLLARSFGGWAVPDALGRWRLGRLAPPSGVPVETWGPDEIISLEADGRPAEPVWRVTVLYARNHRPLSETEIAGAVSEFHPDIAAQLQEPWRAAPAEDPAVRDLWPQARAIEVATALREAADAEALAASLLNALKTPNGVLKVVVPMTAVRLALGPGAIVRLVYPGQDLDHLHCVVGLSPATPNRGTVTAKLWR